MTTHPARSASSLDLDLDLSRLSLAAQPVSTQTQGSSQAYYQTPVAPLRSSSSASNHRPSSAVQVPPPPSGLPPVQVAPPRPSSSASASYPHPTTNLLQPHQVMQPPVHQGPPPHVQLQEPQRRRGVVKFFNSLKGFGFVVDNDPAALGGQEVFCHFSAISGKGGFRSLGEGEEVEYELVQGPKGFQAANLTGPGGRTVQGDPKARLQQKPPPFMPFASLAMPIGGPYLADPYHAQHAGVYAGSPYTQHVVYVPATAALPPSQYAYAPIPLVAPRHHQPGSSASGPAGAGGGGGGGGPHHHLHQPLHQIASPFAAPQYQSYAAPSQNSGGQGGGGAGHGHGQHGGGGGASPNPNANGAGALANQNAGGGGGGGTGAGSSSRFGAATGAYGAPQPPPPPPPPPAHQQQQQQQVPSFGSFSNGTALNPAGSLAPAGGAGTNGGGIGSGGGGVTLANPAFSPPGGNYMGLTETPPSHSGPSFGFAPFSPPSFHHAALFGAPPPLPSQPPPQQQPQGLYALSEPSYPVSSSTPSSATAAGASSTDAVSQSALFGTGGGGGRTASSGSPAPPAPIGSRAGTPSGGGRSTPALGNGNLGNDAWKVSPPSTTTTTTTTNGGGGGGQDGIVGR
ncbi:hypothetical protein JCM10212_003439 [Sporobolomyces blumeae]